MRKYIGWIWHNTQGIRLNIAVRVAVGLIQVGLGLALVWLCKDFIDVTIRTGSDRDVWIRVVVLAGVILGSIGLRQIYYYLGIEARTRQSNDIRLRIFSQLMRRRLFEGKSMHSGDLVSRLEKDIDLISDTIASMMPETLVTCAKLAGAFLMFRWMDATLAWVLLLLTPPFVITGKLIAKRLRNMTHGIRQQESTIQKTIQEGLEHNAVLRALESTGWLTTQVDDMQQELRSRVNLRTRFSVMTRSFMAAIFGLGYLLVFVWGGMQLRNGAITLGVMISFLQLVGQVQHPILSLLNSIPQLIHSTASIDRLTELEQLQTETAATPLPAASDPWGIRLDNISFKYAQGDMPVMNHFSHDFQPGSHTAIMGHTGAGKTTLFRLLLGLTEPATGTITLYNKNEKQLQAGTGTRQYMIYVPQGNTLMSGTIRYNLLLARPDATDEQLRQVLHTAMADFVFDLTNGMDTVIGETGSGLSEGQAQRIAIARGLLRPGNILLLDEISSALDEQTESELFRRLFTASPQKTILLITHRSSVASQCDKTITMGTYPEEA